MHVLMSNEWIDRLAKNVRSRAQNQKTERELRLEAAPLIRANSMALWHSLAKTVRRDIDKLNLVFDGHDRRDIDKLNLVFDGHDRRDIDKLNLVFDGHDRRDIDKLNQVFDGHDRRTLDFGEGQGQKFAVRKAVFLATTLEVELNQEGQRISFQYVRTLDHHTSESASSSGSLEIEMDPSDQLLCLSHQGRLFFNMDEVSWFLLTPIFEYFCPLPLPRE